MFKSLYKKLLFFLITFNFLFSQIGPTFGIRENPPMVYALINAKIIVKSGLVIENGKIVIRKGIIESVGKDIEIPPDAYVIDLKGKWVYPGFIEPYFIYKGEKKIETTSGSTYSFFSGSKEKKQIKKGVYYWNDNVNPQVDIADIYFPDEKIIKDYLSNGFTAALIVPEKGIFKGKSSLFSLLNEKPSLTLLKKDVFEHISFEVREDEDYPNSLMGAIALIRQVFYDVIWHKKVWENYEKNKSKKKPEFIKNLKDLEDFLYGKKKVIFETKDDLYLYRAKKIASEFNLDYTVLGSGYEYRQIELLKEFKNPIIIPLNFEEDLKFETPEEALNVPLSKLLHYKYSPYNPFLLYKNKIEFALTTYGLKSPSEFWDNLKKIIERGFPEEYALKALTEIPAKLLGIYDKMGSIEKGKLAHLLITDEDIFKEGKIYEVFVDGKRIIIREELPELEGKWEIVLNIEKNEIKGEIELKGREDKYSGTFIYGDKKINIDKIKLDFAHINLVLNGKEIGFEGLLNLSGKIENGKIIGKGILPEGRIFDFQMNFKEKIKKEEKKETLPKFEDVKFFFPMTAYGYEKLPETPQYILVKDATLWTASEMGILEGYDMLVENGKIKKISKDIEPPKNAIIIDGKGKHVTPGIIDPHSHIAVTGDVNESGDAITSEVRIEDVLNPYDIEIYRVLSGGVTMTAILHGSANPIGGQCAVIKLKWGSKNPEELLYKNAPPILKFALGENPKQSWSNQSKRYPKTRMGVREIIRDNFLAALDYEKKLKNKKEIIRRDLEKESILEVLKNKRFAWVHSYRQDEILMFINLAKEFGIKNVSFQHALEAYKVAEKIKEAGFSATTFSDWWAYKFEVYDAIPYGAYLMYKTGVLTSLHSDFSEVAKRLNAEAAKIVKYGGLKKEEAIKLITINPAKQLGVDKYVGSLEEGKEADFVIWDNDPLSPFSKVLEVYIEGRKFFDREMDLKLRERDEKLKRELVNYYLNNKYKTKSKPSFEKFKMGG
ncbi:MAG: amidohydrolase family protein [candidate division WOR-3 bacterium]